MPLHDFRGYRAWPLIAVPLLSITQFAQAARPRKWRIRRTLTHDVIEENTKLYSVLRTYYTTGVIGETWRGHIIPVRAEVPVDVPHLLNFPSKTPADWWR
ncbi:hypothetical protein VI817_008137 [Penicillium citrinum]|uniref:Uncharacterized protein n=1 Tax=Penicillium hetheringtonii TaxID=911720 RepID=A0AAD6DLV6_9EURO|nr:hypothetical protein N7450_006438 [Penicillium hetheringtonii]KAK5789013.1 hypothetical protein VI817_008137 [Penicillium citrinum]